MDESKREAELKPFNNYAGRSISVFKDLMGTYRRLNYQLRQTGE